MKWEGSDPDFAVKLLSMMKGPLLVLQALAFLVVKGSEAYDPEASITGLYTGPYFDPLAPRNMTAHIGDEATLPCTVRQLGDKSVSWVRMRDADILTVDRYTFVGDERFESRYSSATETWNLVIKYVQERDAGLYECQVSTEPKMSQLFSLRVVIPKVMIVPAGDRYVKAGSTVRVDCQITDVVQLPDYIFWYHGDKRVMARHDPNLLVTVKGTGVEAITSTLTIHKVRQEQNGNYTCMPSNLYAASVILHVLNEKHPAAMQGERNGAVEAKVNATLLVLLVVLTCTASFFGLQEGSGGSAPKRPSSGPASSAGPPPPSFGVAPAAVLRGEEATTPGILRDLAKEDGRRLPSAREALRGPQREALSTRDRDRDALGEAGDPCWRPKALRLLDRTRVALGIEGHSSAHSWKRQDPRVAALDEASAVLHAQEEEEKRRGGGGRGGGGGGSRCFTSDESNQARC